MYKFTVCRTCCTDSLLSVQNLLRLCWPDYPQWNYIEELQSCSQFVCLWKLDKLVGCCVLKENSRVVEIVYIAVDPLFRGNGLSDKMFKKVVSSVVALRQLRLTCRESLLSFYKKKGFKIIYSGRGVFDQGNGYILQYDK